MTDATAIVGLHQEQGSWAREHYMSMTVFSLLYAASMVDRGCYTNALIFVKNLDDPLATEAVKEYYPTLREESLSMMEHDKERNNNNVQYFHDLQRITLEQFPKLATIKPVSEWDAYVMASTSLEAVPTLPHRDRNYL